MSVQDSTSWFTDKDQGNKIIKAMKSFTATGDVSSRLDDYWADLSSNPDNGTSPDIRLKFLFEPSFSKQFSKKADSVSIINNKNVTNRSMVMYASVSSVKSQADVRNESKATFVEDFGKNNSASLKTTKTTTVTYNDIKWTTDTHDFGNFKALTITAVYPNGMVVCIHAKCANSAKTKLDGYIKDLERSIRLISVT